LQIILLACLQQVGALSADYFPNIGKNCFKFTVDFALQQFKAVEQMDDDDKKTIKSLIDAFITKRKIQQLAL
jgi:hypothetical protein